MCLMVQHFVEPTTFTIEKKNRIENTAIKEKITISTCRFGQFHEKTEIAHQMLCNIYFNFVVLMLFSVFACFLLSAFNFSVFFSFALAEYTKNAGQREKIVEQKISSNLFLSSIHDPF